MGFIAVLIGSGHVRSSAAVVALGSGRVCRTRPYVAGCSHQRTRGGGEVAGPGRLGCQASVRAGWRMVRSGHDQPGLNQLSDRRLVGVMPIASSRLVVSEPHAACGSREAADLAVAQAVVDEREKLAGDRDACLVLARVAPRCVEVVAGASPPW